MNEIKRKQQGMTVKESEENKLCVTIFFKKMVKQLEKEILNRRNGNKINRNEREETEENRREWQ